jgi:hypothetical protein
VAKFILTGQVCVWENDRKQINSIKTANLYFIKRCIVPVKNGVFVSEEKNTRGNGTG